MNNGNAKNFKKKKNEYKTGRTIQGKYRKERNRNKNQKNYYKKDNKPKKKEDQSKPREQEIFIYKQDLIQIGFTVAEGETTNSPLLDAIKKYPQCFNGQKRKVMINKKISDKVKPLQENIEEIKEDFRKLIENEDIPDWYLEEGENDIDFDFQGTVEKSSQFHQKKLDQVQTSVQVHHMKLNEIQGFNEEGNAEEFKDLKSMDFAQLDAYLEKKANKKKVVEEIKEVPSSHSSKDYSNNYFNRIEDNIKNMVLNSSKEDFEDDESDESFQEGLGFHYESQMNLNPKIIPIMNPKINNQDSQQSKTDEKQNKEDEQDIENRKRFFKQKYGYLDNILCQIVYEILHSKKRILLKNCSENGFNQKSVEKYCQNDYKIFSMYTQGNIIPKIWFYKDSTNIKQGPFTSYDMDIWNGEDFFSDSVTVAIMSEKYLPIKKYINRDPEVVQIIERVMLKMNQQQQELEKNRNKNSKKIKKKQKKNQQKSDKPVNLENYNENFPVLEESTGSQKREKRDGLSLLEKIKPKIVLKKVVQKKSAKKVKKGGEVKDDDLTSNLKNILGI